MWTASQAAAYDAWRTSPPPECEWAEDRDDAIDTEFDILTDEGAEFYPYSVANFMEYLADYAPEVEFQSLIDLLLRNKQQARDLATNCAMHWYKEARAKATEIVDSADDDY